MSQSTRITRLPFSVSESAILNATVVLPSLGMALVTIKTLRWRPLRLCFRRTMTRRNASRKPRSPSERTVMTGVSPLRRLNITRGSAPR